MKRSPIPQDSLQQANESMIFRLLGALIRERLFPPPCQIVQWSHPFSGLVEAKLAGYRQLICVKQKQTGSAIYIPIRHRGAFERFRMQSPIWGYFDNEWIHIHKLETLIALLRDHFEVDLPPSLESEVRNSLAYLAYGYEQQAKQNERFRKQLTEQSIHATQYLEALTQLKKKASFDEYLDSEAMAVEGNPLHPCAKTRIGSSPIDQKYLPESCVEIPVQVLLIPKKNLHVTSGLTEDVNAWMFRLIPKLREVAWEACRKKGVPLEAFQLCFVHPWQYKHTILEKYRREWSNWIDLPFQLDGRALLSFRTIDFAQLGIHLKLPVQIQMTNAVRTLSPQATVNGPILSRLCNQLLANTEDYQERMVVLPEWVGVHYRTSEDDPDSFLASNLSYTIREHPRTYIQSGELAFVGAALSEKTPWRQPLIIDLMQNAIGRRELTIEDAVDYVTHYAQRCLPPFLYLLEKYGIALEGHMQNIILVTRQGRIQRILVRDMGGLRVHRARLNSKVGSIGLWESPVLVDEMSEVYNKFLHSVLQNQLGELIFVIADYLQVPEKPLWEKVAQVIRESLAQLAPNEKMDSHELFQPTIQTKALLSMRQTKRSAQDYLYIDLPNPLHKEW